MTIKELHDICEKAIAEGKEDGIVRFDSCAVCFDVHMVPVSSAHIETTTSDGAELRLTFEMKAGICHFY